jgi:hypothetical protein
MDIHGAILLKSAGNCGPDREYLNPKPFPKLNGLLSLPWENEATPARTLFRF